MPIRKEITLPAGQHRKGQNLETELTAWVDPATIDQALEFQQAHTPARAEEAAEKPAAATPTPIK